MIKNHNFFMFFLELKQFNNENMNLLFPYNITSYL